MSPLLENTPGVALVGSRKREPISEPPASSIDESLRNTSLSDTCRAAELLHLTANYCSPRHIPSNKQVKRTPIFLFFYFLFFFNSVPCADQGLGVFCPHVYTFSWQTPTVTSDFALHSKNERFLEVLGYHKGLRKLSLSTQKLVIISRATRPHNVSICFRAAQGAVLMALTIPSQVMGSKKVDVGAVLSANDRDPYNTRLVCLLVRYSGPGLNMQIWSSYWPPLGFRLKQTMRSGQKTSQSLHLSISVSLSLFMLLSVAFEGSKLGRYTRKKEVPFSTLPLVVFNLSGLEVGDGRCFVPS